jgi:hypothetical protein
MGHQACMSMLAIVRKYPPKQITVTKENPRWSGRVPQLLKYKAKTDYSYVAYRFLRHASRNLLFLDQRQPTGYLSEPKTRRRRRQELDEGLHSGYQRRPLTQNVRHLHKTNQVLR